MIVHARPMPTGQATLSFRSSRPGSNFQTARRRTISSRSRILSCPFPMATDCVDGRTYIQIVHVLYNTIRYAQEEPASSSSCPRVPCALSPSFGSSPLRADIVTGACCRIVGKRKFCIVAGEREGSGLVIGRASLHLCLTNAVHR
jgi:hypothetical protein